MDEQIMISDIAQRQTPVLTRTSHLVRCLGMCKMYATTPEAAGIRLPMLQQDASGQVTIVSGGQGRSDLGTELDRIAQNGLDMFSEANMFLNGIRYKIGPLASPGGPLDTLQKDFGKPDAMNNNRRQLNRVERDVTACVENGNHLAAEFMMWKSQAEALRLAIQRENTIAAERANRLEYDIENQDEEYEIAQKNLEQSQLAADAAQAKHNQQLARQQAMNISALHIPSHATLMEYLKCAGSAVGIGVAWYSSKLAKDVVKDTEHEFERKRRVADDCRRELGNASSSLKAMRSKKAQTDEFAVALSGTLRALAILAEEVSSMVTEFGEMKVLMSTMVTRQKEGLDEFTSSSGTPNAYDIKSFVNEALQMRQWAIKVEHLAWLYAETIRQVMVPGLRDVRGRQASYSSESMGSQLLLTSSEEVGNDESQATDTSSSVIFSQVDQSFRGSCDRLARISMAYGDPDDSGPSTSLAIVDGKGKRGFFKNFSRKGRII